MNIDEICKRINTLRLTGGKYTTIEIREALKGLPYYGYIPTAMRNHRNLESYEVTTTGIIFNPKVSLYKEVIITILNEAQEMGKTSAKKSYNKASNKRLYKLLRTYTDEKIPTFPLGLQRFINDLCIKLYLDGKSQEASKILKTYENN